MRQKLLICFSVSLLPLFASNVVYAGYEDGVKAAHRGDKAVAIREFTPLTKAGDIRAKYQLGGVFLDASGSEREHEKGKLLIQEAAEQGLLAAIVNRLIYTKNIRNCTDCTALIDALNILNKYENASTSLLLGWVLIRQKDHPDDQIKGIVFLEVSAKLGSEDAQKELGTLYLGKKYVKGAVELNSDILTANDQKGIYWLEKSANQGFINSIQILAYYYKISEHGADYSRAYFWKQVERKLTRNISGTEGFIKEVSSHLTLPEIQVIDQQVANWNPIEELNDYNNMPVLSKEDLQKVKVLLPEMFKR